MKLVHAMDRVEADGQVRMSFRGFEEARTNSSFFPVVSGRPSDTILTGVEECRRNISFAYLSRATTCATYIAPY